MFTFNYNSLGTEEANLSYYGFDSTAPTNSLPTTKYELPVENTTSIIVAWEHNDEFDPGLTFKYMWFAVPEKNPNFYDYIKYYDLADLGQGTIPWENLWDVSSAWDVYTGIDYGGINYTLYVAKRTLGATDEIFLYSY